MAEICEHCGVALDDSHGFERYATKCFPKQITALQAANKGFRLVQEKLVEELEAAGEMIDRRDRWEQAAGEAKAQLREAEEREAKLIEEKRELTEKGETLCVQLGNSMMQVHELEQDGKRLEEALEFYASPSSWTHGSLSKSWAWQDNGNRARAAMAKERGVNG